MTGLGVGWEPSPSLQVLAWSGGVFGPNGGASSEGEDFCRGRVDDLTDPCPALVLWFSVALDDRLAGDRVIRS